MHLSEGDVDIVEQVAVVVVEASAVPVVEVKHLEVVAWEGVADYFPGPSGLCT